MPANVTLLSLVVTSSFQASPMFQAPSFREISRSKFGWFIGKFSVNSFSKISTTRFFKFLDTPISYTREDCAIVFNETFIERQNLDTSDTGGRKCVSVSSCIFQEIRITEATNGGAIHSSAFTDLSIDSCQFSLLDITGEGACVFFSGTNLHFTKNCINQVQNSKTCISSTASTHDLQFLGAVSVRVSDAIVKTNTGRVSSTHLNITGCSSNLALVSADSSETSIVIGEVTINSCSAQWGCFLRPKAATGVSHGLDTFNVGEVNIGLFNVANGHWLVTRVWMLGRDTSTCTDGTLTYAECYFFWGGSNDKNVAVDKSLTYMESASRWIEHVSVGACVGQPSPATPVPTWRLGGQAKGLIAASVLGGIAIGVLVFLGAYFLTKALCKWRRRRNEDDDDTSAFDLN